MDPDPELRPAGPVDPAVPPQPVTDAGRPAVFTLMAPGWWPPRPSLTQCYGFCFTPERRVLLVSPGDRRWTLPGGTIEPGEDPYATLVREVAEEACARVLEARYLACQHVLDPEAPDGRTSHYQARWWARVELDEWDPHFEIEERCAVPVDEVLATLSWAETAIAGRLLEMALRIEAAGG
ncbi:MAG: NUDIX hydrolase [Candidatus Dormibacteria bacterium]